MKITPKYWRKNSLKTIQIQGAKWFDKVNGNTYCSCVVTINFGLKNEFSFSMPFTYGYGDYYRQMAIEAIIKHGIAPKSEYYNRLPKNVRVIDSGAIKGLKRACKDHGLSEQLVVPQYGDPYLQEFA